MPRKQLEIIMTDSRKIVRGYSKAAERSRRPFIGPEAPSLEAARDSLRA